MKKSRSDIAFFLLVLALFLALASLARAQGSDLVASGGQFVIEKQAIAGGGDRHSSAGPVVAGTNGQSTAGIRSSNGQFAIYSGFWTPDDFTPTAASAVVGGRVRTASGLGIRNALVTLTLPTGAILATRSSTLGYYFFADIPVGGTFVVTVRAKRFSFSQAARLITVEGDVADVDFVAENVQ